MPQPYDYSLGVPSPQESFLAGVQSWQQQQQVNAQMARAKAEQDRIDAEIAETLRAANIFQTRLGPGSTIDDRNAAMRELGPKYVTQVQTMWAAMDEGRRRAYLEAGRSVYNDLMPRPDGTVNIEGAIANLNTRADAAKNSGDTVLEGQLRGLSTTLQNQPASARALQGIIDLQVRAVDPDAADKMTGFGDAAAKMRGAGIDPYSEQGRKLFDSMVFKEGQILVTNALTPDGQPYTGTLDNFLQTYGRPSGGAGGQPAQTAQPQTNAPVLTFDQAIGAVNGLGSSGASAFFNRNGYRIRVQTPTQARKLPSGTKIILPDGSEGTVP